MENVQVSYGRDCLTLSISGRGFEILSCEIAPRTDSGLAEILDTNEFRRYAGKKTLCIVNDGTRPTKTREVIEKAGLACHYIVATGAHAAPTEEELQYIFGPEYGQMNIEVHDARRSLCKHVGVTPRKTPVRFNELIFKFDRILVVGSVEPHYFAGFTGGRKGFLPGVSAYETIEKNHALFFSAGTGPLRLQGNPVHEDMMDAISFLDIPILSLNLVIDKDEQILGAFCGDLEKSFLQAVRLADSYFSVKVARKADLVIACAPYPMDADLYQSHKALLNAARACAPGGEIVLFSQCRNGIGPRAFYELMSSHNTLAGLQAFARDSYHLGYHKAASFAEVLMEHRVSVVSRLTSEELLPVWMHAITPPQAEQMANDVAGRGGTVYYMPQASLTVPIVSAEAR